MLSLSVSALSFSAGGLGLNVQTRSVAATMMATPNAPEIYNGKYAAELVETATAMVLRQSRKDARSWVSSSSAVVSLVHAGRLGTVRRCLWSSSSLALSSGVIWACSEAPSWITTGSHLSAVKSLSASAAMFMSSSASLK